MEKQIALALGTYLIDNKIEKITEGGNTYYAVGNAIKVGVSVPDYKYFGSLNGNNLDPEQARALWNVVDKRYIEQENRKQKDTNAGFIAELERLGKPR